MATPERSRLAVGTAGLVGPAISPANTFQKTGSQQILPENFLFVFSILVPEFPANAIGRV